jgi:hypothetical protein
VHPDIVQSIKDHEHLRILSLLYLVEAAVQVVVGCLAACLAVFGAVVAASDFFVAQGAEVMNLMGLILALLGGLLTIAAWLQAFLDVAVSRALKGRVRRKFCILVATGECIFVPFGTLLAISTFLVLTRPSVRALFGEPPVSAETQAQPQA